VSEVATRLHVNDGNLTVYSEQDVEPILERNKQLRGEAQRSDWGRHTATIPNVILVQWLNEEYARGNTHLRLFTQEFDNEVVKKKLQDPEWAYLRTDSQAVQGFMGFGS
jgi:hypothetical protein